MSSKRRLRRRSCEGKKAYPTREDAIHNAGSLRWWNSGGTWSAYRCRFCGQWHVGRMPAGDVKAMWQRRAESSG